MGLFAPTKRHLSIRWAIRKDLPEMLAIERASFEYPWTEEEFLRHLQGRATIGMVAESGDRVVGFMVYELHRRRIEVIDFAVAPESRRQGVGRRLIDKLASKLDTTRRTHLAAWVREQNLAGQLFLRAMGFLAVSVARGHFRDSGEDGYRFEYRIGEDD